MRIRASVIVAIVLTIAVAGWLLSGQFGGNDMPTATASGDTAAAAGEERAALTRVRVKRMTAREHNVAIRVRGRSQASRRVDIRTETEGPLVELLARRGDKVQEGQTLGRLAVEEREARLAEVEARLRQRRIHHEATTTLAQKGLASEEALASAQADVDAATAMVEQVRIEVARTELRAPFDGLLLAGHAEVGAWLKKGELFARIIDLDPILFVGSVTERAVWWLRPGMPATATGLGKRSFTGTLRYVAPAADAASRTYRIEVEFPNPGHRVPEGLTGDLTINVATAQAHFVTPALLTLADDGTIGIKTVEDDNRVRFREVEIVEDTPDGVWLSGLPREMTVITVGQEFVVDGQEVEPVPEDEATTPGGARDEEPDEESEGGAGATAVKAAKGDAAADAPATTAAPRNPT